jgi:hypothetical protein
MVNAASMAVKSRRIDGAAESERHADAVTPRPQRSWR